MLGLALRAWLLSLALLPAALLCLVVLVAIFGLAYAMLMSPAGVVNVGITPGALWPVKAVGLAVAALCQFQVGRWLARPLQRPNSWAASPPRFSFQTRRGSTSLGTGRVRFSGRAPGPPGAFP